jgi:hypothetical protein
VSACDKLHNLRSTVSDLSAGGPSVWKRFNSAPEQQLWYYDELAKIFSVSLSSGVSDAVLRELATLRALNERPEWWDPKGRRDGVHGLGRREGEYLRQSDSEALIWAHQQGLTPSEIDLTRGEVNAVERYSDGVSYQRINEDYYDCFVTPTNSTLERALTRAVITTPVIVWRGAGYKLFRYPERGDRLFIDDPTTARGRTFVHRPPISTSVGNDVPPIGRAQSVQYKIRVQAGVRGLFIPEIAVKGNEEHELLLAPGTRLRIDKVDSGGSHWFVLATARPGL